MLDAYSTGFTEVHVPDAGNAVEKRNLGVEIASNEWIVFVDDDCEVSHRTFTKLNEVITEESTPTIGAFYPVTEFAGPIEFPLRCCDRTHFTNHFYASRHNQTREWGPCTLATFRREALETVGGFDESFAMGAGGEDVDIGLRLNAEGYQQRGLAEILAYHDSSTWNSVVGNLRRFFAYGLGEALLQRNHPDRAHLKLNAIGMEVVVVLLPVLILALLQRSPQLLGAIPLFFLFVFLSYGIYNRIAYGKSLLEGTVLRLYDYTFETGSLYDAAATGSIRAPFFRHKSGAEGQGQFRLGRDEFVYSDEVPTLVAALGTYITLLITA